MDFFKQAKGILDKKGSFSDTVQEMGQLAGTQAKVSAKRVQQKNVCLKMGQIVADKMMTGYDPDLDALLVQYVNLEQEIRNLERPDVKEGEFTEKFTRETKVCPVCGALVDVDAAFCTDCGNRF